MAVLIPITRPSTSTSGPPELPGLIAASVWIASTSVSVAATCTVRPRPDTIPVVTVGLPAMPSELPIATTASPTWSASELPRRTVGSPVRLIFRTARSWVVSSPSTRARTESPVLSVTMSWAACCAVSALATWALVTMIPLGSTMKPVPVPDWLPISSGCVVTSIRTTAGSTFARIERMSPGLASAVDGRAVTPELAGRSSRSWCRIRRRRRARRSRRRLHRRRAHRSAPRPARPRRRAVRVATPAVAAPTDRRAGSARSCSRGDVLFDRLIHRYFPRRIPGTARLGSLAES